MAQSINQSTNGPINQPPTLMWSKGIKKASLTGITFGVLPFPENVCRLCYDMTRGKFQFTSCLNFNVAADITAMVYGSTCYDGHIREGRYSRTLRCRFSPAKTSMHVHIIRDIAERHSSLGKDKKKNTRIPVFANEYCRDDSDDHQNDNCSDYADDEDYIWIICGIIPDVSLSVCPLFDRWHWEMSSERWISASWNTTLALVTAMIDTHDRDGGHPFYHWPSFSMWDWFSTSVHLLVGWRCRWQQALLQNQTFCQ